jgi:acyl-CoA reductase-like NAD-dependent aldehyde dehydrogenase
MDRINVLKTYKLYIGGQFPRTESGRFYPVQNSSGKLLANACRGSRKDFRNAVVAARSAFGGWSGKTPFNRGQILYRLAEMMESRKAQLVEELQNGGMNAATAKKETEAAIDFVVYYAGWCDKYHHFLGSFLPAVAGGNTVVVLASESKPLVAITLAEIIHASDFPGGVINILTGYLSELHSWMASHMDVNALISYREAGPENKKMGELAAGNVKRTFFYKENVALDMNPYRIAETQEIKTTWHPIENIGSAKAGY